MNRDLLVYFTWQGWDRDDDEDEDSSWCGRWDSSDQHLHSGWWKLIFVRPGPLPPAHITPLPSILSASFRGKTNKQTYGENCCILVGPGGSSNQSNSISETLSSHCRRPHGESIGKHHPPHLTTTPSPLSSSTNWEKLPRTWFYILNSQAGAGNIKISWW